MWRNCVIIMTMTRIIYYTYSDGRNPIKDFLESLEKNKKAKVFRIFQYIELYGLSSVLPHLKKIIGTKLWEIRILGSDNIRILYIVVENNDILVLNGFVKKTQKTPTKELTIALDRALERKTRQTP